MQTITERAVSLQAKAHYLLYPSEDIFFDELDRLKDDAARDAAKLCTLPTSTDEEEYTVCLALLMTYAATMHGYSAYERFYERILQRAEAIVRRHGDLWERCRLLTYLYGETFNVAYADEAFRITSSWKDRPLLKEEAEIIETLESLVY